MYIYICNVYVYIYICVYIYILYVCVYGIIPIDPTTQILTRMAGRSPPRHLLVSFSVDTTR